jgi:ubiquitin carboxyl-terminal hydrolase L3
MGSITPTTHAEGVFINSKGIKTFVPLENNPEVFTHLVHELGVSPELGFYDIYSIDDDDLLALVPRPVHAIIFIAPANVYYKLHSEGKPKELTYAGTGDHEPVIWFKQTIGHSCGLMALIHSIGNGQAKQFIKPDSLIDKLLKEALPLKPLPRADVLYNSADLEKAHMSAAYKGDSKAPSSEDPNGYHFLAFVKGKDGHLWELDGSWDGPIDHGLLLKEDDLLSKKAIELGIGKYVKLADGCIEYSMVALATNSEA